MLNRKPLSLGDGMIISPPESFPGSTGVKYPGDLSRTARYGSKGLGFQNAQDVADILVNAPKSDPCGGVLFFGERAQYLRHSDWLALAGIIGLSDEKPYYAIFAQEAENPKEEGYLSRIRIVSSLALENYFDSIDDFRQVPAQIVSQAEAGWRFIKAESERWGRGELAQFKSDEDRRDLHCYLSFGVVVENQTYGIYQLLSRFYKTL